MLLNHLDIYTRISCGKRLPLCFIVVLKVVNIEKYLKGLNRACGEMIEKWESAKDEKKSYQGLVMLIETLKT